VNIIQLLKEESIWHKKAFMISLYHSINSMADDKWTIRDTAKELNLSIGLVCEDLQLTEAIKKNEKLLELSRNAALKEMRNEK